MSPHLRPDRVSWVMPTLISRAEALALIRRDAGEPDCLMYAIRDRAAGPVLWSRSDIDDDVLHVDHDAVYVMRNNHDLVALAADTGVSEAELMIGMPFMLRVEPVGGAGGPWVVLEDQERALWVIGRREQPVVAEAFEIRGRLVPIDGLDPKSIGRTQLEVAGQQVETDSKGRFVLHGRGRGFFSIEPKQMTIDLEYGRVQIDGTGRYDLGEIETYVRSLEVMNR